MKILLVHPGAAVAVADVYDGLHYGLKAHGVEVIPYGLYGRIGSASNYMHFLWRKYDKAGVAMQKPTWSDVLYHASTGLLERALRHQVDLVLCVSGMYLHPDALVLMRRAGIKVGMIFTESPYSVADELKLAQYVDIAWTNERSSVETFKRVCPRAYYLRHAWHPLRHMPDLPVPSDVAHHDVVFVGTAWPERVAFFEAIDWRGIDLGIYGWQKAVSKKLKHVVHDPVKSEITSQLYRNAKVGINLHRGLIGFDFVGGQQMQAGVAQSANPRAFELAACGVFHISDRRAEVVEQFGDAVPTFESPAEAEHLIRLWLADDVGRARAARQLPALVAEDSWLSRAAEVYGHLESFARERRAA